MTSLPPTFDELFEKWGRLLEPLDIDPGGTEAADLRSFLEQLQTANEKVRLVGNASAEELFLTHAVDSLLVLQATAARRRTERSRCVDVGSGGGFPGIPLRLARPQWSFAFVESVNKKSDFLRDALDRLQIKNCTVLSQRAEELAMTSLHREQYDLGFCRAVGSFTTVAELVLPFLRVGGAWLAHRGEKGAEEAKEAAEALAILGGELTEVVPYKLPNKDLNRHIVCIQKIQPTPPYYPRRNGMPAKKPL